MQRNKIATGYPKEKPGCFRNPAELIFILFNPE